LLSVFVSDVSVDREFLVIAPKVVRPNMVYEVHVTVNRKYYSNIVVTALLSSDGNEYASGRAPFSDIGTKTIQLLVGIVQSERCLK
jgi:hypothetical protein